MGRSLKKIAGFALPIIGTAVGGPIGGALGAALGGAASGGGIKGALTGVAAFGLGNFVSGALGNVLKGAPIGQGLSFFGSPAAASAGSTAATAGRATAENLLNAPAGLGRAAGYSAAPISASTQSGGLFGDLFGGGGSLLDNASTLLNVATLFQDEEDRIPEGLRTQEDIQREIDALNARQQQQNERFIDALNAAPLNRNQTRSNIDYSRYGQTGYDEGDEELLFFDEVNPRLPYVQLAKGGLVHGEDSGQEDTVPAMLSPGEYVMTAEEVAAAGDGNTKAGAHKLKKLGRKLVAKKRSSKARNPKKAKSDLKKYMEA